MKKSSEHLLSLLVSNKTKMTETLKPYLDKVNEVFK